MNERCYTVKGIDNLFFPSSIHIFRGYGKIPNLGNRFDSGKSGVYEITARLTELIPDWNEKLGIPRKVWGMRVHNGELKLEME